MTLEIVFLVQIGGTVHGIHVRTIPLPWPRSRGIAITPDGSNLMAVSNWKTDAIDVYTLSDGALLRSIGNGKGDGKSQFNSPQKLCFSPMSGYLLVADSLNNRVKEVCIHSGQCVRIIGSGVIQGGAQSIAVTCDLLAVGTSYGLDHTSPMQVVLFNLSSGDPIRSFGVQGRSEGQLENSVGIRFTPDANHIVITENASDRLSLFTLEGNFVRCIGVGTLKCPFDVTFACNGDMIIVDKCKHRICVYTPDGPTLLRTIGEDDGLGPLFSDPIAVTMFRGQLYVAEWANACVKVFA